MSNPSPRVFPTMLRALRLHHGLTQRQLAERLDLPQSAISHHENLDRSAREDVLTRYAAAFGYPDLLAMLAHGIRLLRAPSVEEGPPDADLMNELLERQGWQRQELAEQLKVTPSFVTHVLSGKKNLSPKKRARLKALHARMSKSEPTAVSS